MKGFDTNIGPVQSALEQAPEVFQAVRVNATVCVADSVVNHSSVIITLKVVVGHERVGADGRTLLNKLPNVSAKLWPAIGPYYFQNYARRFAILCPLQDALNGCFLDSRMANASSLISMHVASFGSNVGF